MTVKYPQAPPVVECIFCANTHENHLLGNEVDARYDGYWCGICDYFNFFDETLRHRFTLILEKKDSDPITSKPTPFRLRKQLSPLRYPGGKSKVIDYLYHYIRPEKARTLSSPYTGGGSLELSLLEAGVVENLYLNDKDTGVYSLWWMMLHAPDFLIERLQNQTPTKEDYFRYREHLLQGYTHCSIEEAAWMCLVVNRLAYSGIPFANPLGGRNGTPQQLLSRWKPERLIERIRTIAALAPKIKLANEDALSFIEEEYWEDHSTMFIDPPYFVKGSSLYPCAYTEGDHVDLCYLLHDLYQGFSGPDLVVTYDYHQWLEERYFIPDIQVIGRVYSA